MGGEISAELLGPVWLTVHLALVTVGLLLVLGVPYAWWLANTRSHWKTPLEAVTALPLVLPPTVMGFYLLLFLGPNGWGGAVAGWFGMRSLAFSFIGLVIASCVYSLPFVVQPLQAAFEGLDRRAVDAAWTLGASKLKTFAVVVLPQARRGLITAVVLGFAHTLGEFGVVLMVGGNIPGETQVLSIAVYEQVETLNYAAAHQLSAALLIFSFLVLSVVYLTNRRWTPGLHG